MVRFLTRLQRTLLRRERDDRELDEELRFHVAQETQLGIERGLSPDTAERAARVAIGSLTATREATRAVWVSTRFEQLMQDLKAGSRIVVMSPGLTAAAVVLIALVIGVNTTVFTVVHGVLEKAAPGVRADGLVTLTWKAADDWIEPETGFPNYQDLGALASTVRLSGAFADRLTLSDDNGSHAVWGAQVSANYFDVLGVGIVAGRGFTADEHAAAPSGLVAILSHAAWQAYFHGAPDIAGTAVLLNGHPATIVGVAAAPFRGSFLAPALDVWVPYAPFARAAGKAETLLDRRGRGPILVGQLLAGHSIRDARSELSAIWTRLKAGHQEIRQDLALEVLPNSAVAGGNGLASTQGNTFLAIFAVITLITLLIAGANVANLLIGRAILRQRELALRQSLGATRGRIVRLLLAEGMAIATLAWLGACLIAWAMSRAVIPLVAAEQPVEAALDVSPDWTVVGYALGWSALGLLVVTLAPALRAWRQPLLPWLKAGEQGIVQGRSRVSTALVVLQLACSVLLMVAAGLAYRSVSLLGNADLGYSTHQMLLATVRTVGISSDRQARAALLERLRERLAGVPGIAAVSYARSAPQAFWPVNRIRVDGGAHIVSSEFQQVGPDFLAAFGLAPVAGTDVSAARIGAGSWAVVTESLAASLWPGVSAIGRTLTFGQPERTAEVIGIAPDAFLGGYRRTVRPRLVLTALPDMPDPLGEATFYVRRTAAVEAIVGAVHREVRRIDPRAAVVSIRTLDDQLSGVLAPIQLVAALLALFGGGCLLIAAIGQYAAVSFDTRRRVREIGVRMTLGASARQVLTSVLGDGFRSTAIGLAIGFALSVGVATALGGVLYGITPTDAVTYIAVFALLAGASLVACVLPARRAASIDPIKALRYE